MKIVFYHRGFNRRFSIYDQWQLDKLPEIITDRDVEIIVSDNKDLVQSADVVIIDLPFLMSYYRAENERLGKKQNQIWVAWCLECEKNYSWMASEKITRFIDIWMTYRLNSDIVLAYYDYSFLKKLYTPPSHKTKDVYLFISSAANHSARLNYLAELMEYLPVDSYGSWKRNCYIANDKGYTSKLDLIKNYKFTLAFENAIGENYVTEKFFDPLLVGSVPVYWGAPDIQRFAPGVNSFIDASGYRSLVELARTVSMLCKNETSYGKLLEWKHQPLKKELYSLIEEQKVHPFQRLVDSIRNRENKKSANPFCG